MSRYQRVSLRFKRTTGIALFVRTIEQALRYKRHTGILMKKVFCEHSWQLCYVAECLVSLIWNCTAHRSVFCFIQVHLSKEGGVNCMQYKWTVLKDKRVEPMLYSHWLKTLPQCQRKSLLAASVLRPLAQRYQLSVIGHICSVYLTGLAYFTLLNAGYQP